MHFDGAQGEPAGSPLQHHEGQTKKIEAGDPGPSLVSPASKLAGQGQGRADGGDRKTRSPPFKTFEL